MEHTPDIIPKEERDAYSKGDWGSSLFTVGDDEMEALKDGKLFAMFDGEYTTYVEYDPDF